MLTYNRFHLEFRKNSESIKTEYHPVCLLYCTNMTVWLCQREANSIERKGHKVVIRRDPPTVPPSTPHPHPSLVNWQVVHNVGMCKQRLGPDNEIIQNQINKVAIFVWLEWNDKMCTKKSACSVYYYYFFCVILKFPTLLVYTCQIHLSYHVEHGNQCYQNIWLLSYFPICLLIQRIPLKLEKHNEEIQHLQSLRLLCCQM